MLDQCHAARFRLSHRLAAVVLALAGGLTACADADPAHDPVELTRAVRQGVGSLLRNDPPPPPSANVTPPPDEGRPYPNLASVPTRPARVVARVRDAEIDTLNQDRDAAESRAQAVRERSDIGSTTGQEGLGTVVADPLGAFSPGDERVLRQAAGLARRTGGRIRLQGEVQASLAAADYLGRLGVGRDRIDLVPAPQPDSTARRVEIMVASGRGGR